MHNAHRNLAELARLALEAQRARLDETPVSDLLLITAAVGMLETMRYVARLREAIA